MSKLTLEDLANLNNPTSAVATINANNALIEAALENTLSRDGTSPNNMTADLDLDGNTVINSDAATGTFTTADSKTVTVVDGVITSIV